MEIDYLVYKVKTINGTGWLFVPELPEKPYFDEEEALRQLKRFCAEKEALGCIISSVTEICANASSTPRVAFRDKEYHQMLSEAIKHPKESSCCLDLNGKTRFEHDGKLYFMTEEEIEAAYRYQLHQYLLENAKQNLNIFVFGLDDGSAFNDPEDEETKASFVQQYGISYEQATSDEMLEKYLQEYVNHQDGSESDNVVWENAIHEVLSGYMQYFEVDLTKEDSMCIRAVKQPTVAGLTKFLADDLKLYGSKKVKGFRPISREDARKLYDFEDEVNWPIYGKEDA